jgi:hypothetical protein
MHNIYISKYVFANFARIAGAPLSEGCSEVIVEENEEEKVIVCV